MKQNTAVALFIGCAFLALQYNSIMLGMFAGLIGILLFIELL